MIRSMLSVGVVLFAACVTSSGVSAYVIGSTPRAAAAAATKKHAAHDVVAWNQPGVSYTFGGCRLLHRRPYLAYNCFWELHGVAAYCHGVLTVAVRRQPDGYWRAVGVKSWYTDDHGC